MRPAYTGLHPRRRFGLRRVSSVTVICVLVAAATAGGAVAATSGASVTETINVGLRSLTVSPTSAALCTPASPLTLPNGNCVSPTITITEGPAGGHVDVNGADATPVQVLGNSWVLCSPAAGSPLCLGASNLTIGGTNPGTDQYYEQTAPNTGPSFGNVGTVLSNTPACDLAFDSAHGDCVANPAQSATEVIGLIGPTSSNDQSTSFTSSVTWTAAP